MTRDSPLRISIVGCGVSAISLSIKLLDEFPKKGYIYGRDWTLKIYERGDGPGGTWRYNTYPSCACDVPVHLYSLSTHLNPNWPTVFASQSTILSYWDELFDRYELSKYTCFHTTFQKSNYSSTTQTHTLFLSNDKGEQWTVDTDIFISAIGGFSAPSEPKLGEFKGIKFHSTQWPDGSKEPFLVKEHVEGADPKVEWMKGKRVGVIGNGSTASQIVPAIVNVEGIEVHQFVRTPNYIAPRVVAVPIRLPLYLAGLSNFPKTQEYSNLTKFLFRWIPGLLRGYRWWISFVMQLAWFSFRRRGNARNIASGKILANYMRSKMPSKYYDTLIPTYEFGCKRVISDPPEEGYLSALWKKNLSVHKLEKVEVVDNGVIVNGKVIELDVLIYATGFSVADEGLTLNVGGRDRDLSTYWKEKGGPEAYVGILVPGIPNFMMLVGPNVISGNLSIISFMEAQLSYVVDLLDNVVGQKKRNIGAFEIKESVSDAFNKNMQSRLSLGAANGSCNSWYRAKGTGKITTVWPGLWVEWWWRTRKVRWNDIDIQPRATLLENK